MTCSPPATASNSTCIALDIDPAMVAATAVKTAGLISSSMDVATGWEHATRVLYNILHVAEPVRLLREAYRAVEPGGTAGIIHWKRGRETPRVPIALTGTFIALSLKRCFR